MSYQFPVDTCVVACSGPSLNKVDVFSLGLPVCAISTAIRSIPNPNYWFLADHLNEMHGKEGRDAWKNENIAKVVPSKSVRDGDGKNVIQHPYLEGREANRQYESLLFDPSKPLLRGPHKTLTFAIQWLHVSGVKNIIFAGNDLSANSFESKYSYPIEQFDKKKEHNFKKTIDQIKEALINWYPIARAKGYQWYSWNCGPIFEEIVPAYTPTVLESVSQVVPVIQQPIQVPVQPVEIYNEDISKSQYFELMKEQKLKEQQQEKTNNLQMDLYFDLLHKRRK